MTSYPQILLLMLLGVSDRPFYRSIIASPHLTQSIISVFFWGDSYLQLLTSCPRSFLEASWSSCSSFIELKQHYTPLLSWQINKNFDPRTGILHIVRDPQGIPKIPLTHSESSIWGRNSPLKWPSLQRPLQILTSAANGGNEFVAKFWCVLKKKFQNPTIISWVIDGPP